MGVGELKVVLINLPLLGLKRDPFGSIPSIPVSTTYLAAFLRSKGIDVRIIDGFGERPTERRILKGKYEVRGLPLEDIVDCAINTGDVFGISVHSGAQHGLCLEILSLLKSKRPHTPLVVGGAEATALYRDFLSGGADFVVLGEGEQTIFELIQHLEGRKQLEEIDGLAWKDNCNPKTRFIENLDSLPFPAIDLIPLENYWKLGYAHGPFIAPYTFLITSRGCPFNCNFCAAPSLWQRKWRARSAINVVDEIESRLKEYGITDFHIQDDNFSFNRERTIEICNEIVRRGLDITWCLAAGMKVETIDEAILQLMKEAGCRYISVSPETGSRAILKAMNKPFDYDHFLRIMKAADRLGIKVQACFVLGYSGETRQTLAETRRYISTITRAGVDELGLFLMTPLPGAAVWKSKWNFQEQEELSFSPRWRKDYCWLNSYRVFLYVWFFILKAINHPLKMLRHIRNIMLRKFETKSEMTVFRVAKALLRR